MECKTNSLIISISKPKPMQVM